MTSDDAIRAAERSGDRAALVPALVRAGRGQEAVARCGLHVGDVVRRARQHEGWERCPKKSTWPFEFGQIGDEGRVTGLDEPHGQANVRWPTCASSESWSSDVYTLDLVEPGDGECVLPAQAASLC